MIKTISDMGQKVSPSMSLGADLLRSFLVILENAHRQSYPLIELTPKKDIFQKISGGRTVKLKREIGQFVLSGSLKGKDLKLRKMLQIILT